jgi:hypothetical protein
MKKVLLLLFVFIISCKPSIDAMKKDIVGFELPHLPTKNNAVVYVVRPEYLGFLVKFDVSVDNKPVGYTRGNQHIYFDVLPGNHIISSGAENVDKYKIDARIGDVIFIHQEPAMGLGYARNNLSVIDDIKGKYYVKHTNFGTITNK